MRTTDRMCDRDLEMRKRMRSSSQDPELLAHIAECAECHETFLVAVWMQELAEVPVAASALPTAAYLRWRARILQRWEANRTAVTPIDVGEHAQIGVGLIGTVLLLVWLWRQVDPLAASSTVPYDLAAVMVMAAMLLAVTVVVVARTLVVRR